MYRYILRFLTENTFISSLVAMFYLIKYLLFEMFKIVFESVQKVFWHFKGIAEPPKSQPVRLMNIIYRLKRDSEEISRCGNFISTHETFENVDILRDSTWSM